MRYNFIIIAVSILSAFGIAHICPLDNKCANVQEYRAVGDGITDDTEAIQRAIDTGICDIYFPKGHYLVSSLKVGSGQTLRGCGKESKIICNSDIFATTISNKNISGNGELIDCNINIEKLCFDGSNKVFKRWLTVSDPEADYLPSGIIGQGGTIQDVINAGRREGDYQDGTALMKFAKCDNVLIEDCHFEDYNYRVIEDLGCNNFTCNRNDFLRCGKDDGPFHCIWSQSFGTPAASFYRRSTLSKITNNCFYDIERSAALLSPIHGEFSGNLVSGFGESAVFCPPNGRDLVIENNTFEKGVITDITCNGVEVNACDNVVIKNNFIRDIDGTPVGAVGVKNLVVDGNTFENITGYSGIETVPYGPFSERYSFNEGLAPIAGLAYNPNSYIVVGNVINPAINHIIVNNIAYEDRGFGITDFVYSIKAGINNQAKHYTVHGNIINSPHVIDIVKDGAINIYDTNHILIQKENTLQ